MLAKSERPAKTLIAVDDLQWYDTSFEGAFDTCTAAVRGCFHAAAFFAPCAYVLLISHVIITEGFIPLPDIILLSVQVIIGLLVSIFGVFFAFIPVAAMISAFNQSLGFPLKARSQITMMGGGIAYIFIGAPSILAAIDGDPLVLSYGALAMTLGHVCSLRYALKPEALVPKKKRVAQRRYGSKPKFRLIHLFVLTTWVAACSGIVRATNSSVAIVMLGYISFQSIFLTLDGLSVLCHRKRIHAG